MSKQILWLALIVITLTNAKGGAYAQPSTQNIDTPSFGTGAGFSGYRFAETAALPPQTPLSQSPDSSVKVILLNNDHIVRGEILNDGVTVQVRNELGVIQIQRNDIAHIAATLPEIYRFKQEKTQKTAAGHLQLADWCVANKLPDEAAEEFDRAILRADDRQLADSIRNHKTAALSMFEEHNLKMDMVEQENRKYRQWLDKIPQTTVATFKREILPMLVQNCSGIACHSANSLNNFRFVPNPNNKDVDVAKNLRVVLGYVTPGVPEESPLVLVPIAPHGRTQQIFTRRNIKQYEKLYLWAEQVADEMDAYYPLDGEDRVTAAAERKRRKPAMTTMPDTEKIGMTLQQASGDSVPFPTPGENLVEPQTPNNASMQKTSVQNVTSQNGPTSLSQGLISNAGPSNFPPLPQQRADFNFFEQRSIVPTGTAPGGWQRPAQPLAEPQNQEAVTVTHDSTEIFEKNSVLQQLQREPLDPFDPVLFNRQYHLKRIQENVRQ